MRCKALQTFKGSREEGLVPRGETFETTGRRARVLAEKGLAEPVEKAEMPEHTDKMERPSYEQKQQPAPDRSWEGSGSWKTLREGGEEVAKVQATAEEAKAWASGDATLDEIQ